MSSLNIQRNGHVAVVEINRPPRNYLAPELLADLADAFEACDEDPDCRALLLCAAGTVFCAGADMRRAGENAAAATPEDVMRVMLRLFSTRKPIIAAVQGPALGGGLGLTMVADFRVASPEASFGAPFVKLGFHPGFGLSYLLPRLLGPQRASLLLYTARRVGGEEAVEIGLADKLTPLDDLRSAAAELASEIAANAPLAVQATRRTLRAKFVAGLEARMRHEFAELARLRETEDFQEGIRASAERRAPKFVGR